MSTASATPLSEYPPTRVGGTNLAVALSAITILIAALLVSCSSDRPGRSDTGTVDSRGFEISAGSLTLRGDSGVAPEGTTVSARSRADSLFGERADSLIPISETFDIVLGGGSVQPATPIHARFAVDGGQVRRLLDSGVELVAVSRPDDTDSFDYLPAVFDAVTNTVTVDLPHLSGWSLFGFDPAKFVDSVLVTVKHALGLNFPKPDCVGRTADFAISKHEITAVTNDVAWGCIHVTQQGQEGTLGIDLYSNTPYLWKIDTTPDPIRTRVHDLDLSTYPAGALYQQIIGRNSPGDAFLLPGGAVTMEFGQYNLSPQSGALSYDTGTYVVGLIGYGMSTVLGKLNVGKYPKLLESAEALDCLSQLARSYADISAKLAPATIGAMIHDVIGCIGKAGRDWFANIVAFFGGALAGAVIGPLISFLSLRLQAQSASFRVTVDNGQGRADGTVATDHGYGRLELGMTAQDVTGILTPVARDVTTYRRCRVISNQADTVWDLAVWLNTDKGVVTGIETPQGTTTDRGVGDGSTPAQVLTAYSADHTIEQGNIGGQGSPAVIVRAKNSPAPGRFICFPIKRDGSVGPPSIGRPYASEGC
ncbi:hypothetical protein [Nocardia salmonicida]|uniref:hypothetical protein n=1 Tax=Nocardia salmonicida TaxID=53431 RepID=UPI0036279328